MSSCTSFDTTGLVIIAMLVYGFIALCSSTISFDIWAATFITIGVFVIEIFANLFSCVFG